MLFNSIEFALFLPITFVLYWFVVNRNLMLQNAFVLLASYFFYGWWDWRFLLLIIFSCFVDYGVGIGLGRTQDKPKRKLLLLASISVNLGFLGIFKYFNFFAESFVQAFTFLGAPISDPALLNIVLPVGISFYTFQSLSYSIDVYRGKLEPTKDLVAFFAFVSFFPQLVAGPIERAKSLLPQFYKERVFVYEHAVDGMRQMLWGLFKKIVIADNCATYVDEIFSSHTEMTGSTLLLGAVLFAFQIYADFSGYSDIAIGAARLFGFRLSRNFAFPYFSRDIAEFWRRWHISLSSWFRDYVYISLGGNKGGTTLRMRNILVVFVVSGFWHGANWTFLFWGLLNAIYFLPLMLLNRNRTHLDTVAQGRILPSIAEVMQMASTFALVLIGWIFFRAENLTHAMEYLNGLISPTLFTKPEIFPTNFMALLSAFVAVEWLQREKQYGLQMSASRLPAFARWSVYYLLVLLMIGFGGEQQQFIYFVF